MENKKPPHKQITNKSNGLSSTQEVTYPSDYKRADEAFKKQEINETPNK
ncbi:YfhE-like protein [Alteribacillus persepolensis]|uniref:YfhE-like protein n=1 Tax=Alteribacillus persepolensis TaxID=568899 RepID=A0A1G8JW24_9BACI|nr:YfhE family protein [Alteribacillus persepolensis]SDI35341.1 YfhE-like protein [Alteribacillus persepolensis]